MNNFQVQILVVFLITVNLLISSVEISYAQNSTENKPSVEDQILISKTASGNTIISNGSSSVGGFSTTYAITGTANDIKNSKDLITSSILNDFANSSTIGYVKLSDSNPDSDQQQMANPFASNEQIGQKIEELMDKSIAGVTNSESDMVSITCHFGNTLDLFSCSMNSLLD